MSRPSLIFSSFFALLLSLPGSNHVAVANDRVRAPASLKKGGEAVPAERRALIAMTGLGNRKKGIVKLIYKLEDRLAARIFEGASSAYKHVAFIEGRDANLQDFAQAIYDFENDDSVDAIDVVMNMHGRPHEICFWSHSEGPCQAIEEAIALLKQIPSNDAIGPRKLRALYTDACHAETQLDAWLSLGFRAVAGTRLYDINHTGDIRRYLGAWTNGKTFAKAIRKANRVTLWDAGEWINKESDSEKVVKGDDALRISSPVLD